MKKVMRKRPTEVITGVGLAGVVYGFLAESGVPNVLAAVLGAIIGFGPGFISAVVDALRG